MYGLGAITVKVKHQHKVYYGDRNGYSYLDNYHSLPYGGPLSPEYKIVAPTTLWRW